MKKMDECGQLLLIAGFAIGLLLLISTVLLNSIIFTSNIAAESSADSTGYDTANIIQLTSHAFQEAHENDRSFNESYLERFTSKMKLMYAHSGYIVSITNGSFYDPYFTENGQSDGNLNWTVVKSVENVSNFTITIPENNFTESEHFQIKISGLDNELFWVMTLRGIESGVNITVKNSTDLIYSSENSSTYLDLDIIENSGYNYEENTQNGPYHIQFVNGSHAEGYYLIEGELAGGMEFKTSRKYMVDADISLRSDERIVRISVPVSIPINND